MSNSIKLSPKYGVNPSMTTCFWCGETTGIALMGRIGGRNDKEAPKYCFGGYEPCDKCKTNTELGTTVIEASKIPLKENQPEIQKGIYPTGRWIVMKKEAAKRCFNIDSSKLFVDNKIFDNLVS